MTIKEALNKLPDGYRERALENFERYAIPRDREDFSFETEYDDIANAIFESFSFSLTPEGVDFWWQVMDHYSKYSSPSPLPHILKGSGTDDDPYQIWTQADLENALVNPNGCFKLMIERKAND